MNWRYRETVLALCTLAFFTTMVGRLVISPVVPILTAEFGVTNSVIGVALTGMWMAYFAAQFPSSVLVDRFGERPVIPVAVGGTAVASAVLAALLVFVFAALVVNWTFSLGYWGTDFVALPTAIGSAAPVLLRS